MMMIGISLPVQVCSVGVDDSSTNWLGSSVAERPACDGVVPGSIPGLAFSFSSYMFSSVGIYTRHWEGDTRVLLLAALESTIKR